MQCCELCRRAISQRAVRSLLVVCSASFCRASTGREPAHLRALIPQPSMETLHESVLYRTACPAKTQLHLVAHAHAPARLQNSLPLSTAMLSGYPSRSGFTPSNTRDTSSRQQRPLPTHTLSRVLIHHAQHPKRSSVHYRRSENPYSHSGGPHTAPLGTARRAPSSVVTSCAQSTPPLDTPVHPLLIHMLSLTPQQHLQSPIPVAHIHPRQLSQRAVAAHRHFPSLIPQ